MQSFDGPPEASLLNKSNNDKIPADVLNQIFRDLVDYKHAWSRFLPEDLRKRYFYEWCVVLSVCRFWRAVALACPYMWRYVGNDSPERLRRLRVLARGVPLVLRLNEDEDDGFRRVIADLRLPSGGAGDDDDGYAKIEELEIRGRTFNLTGLEVGHPSYRSIRRLALTWPSGLGSYEECAIQEDIVDVFPSVRSLDMSASLWSAPSKVRDTKSLSRSMPPRTSHASTCDCVGP